jgi:hypothetical protein
VNAAEEMLMAKGKENDAKKLLFACQKELKRIACPYYTLDQIRKDLLKRSDEIIKEVSEMQLTGV